MTISATQLLGKARHRALAVLTRAVHQAKGFEELRAVHLCHVLARELYPIDTPYEVMITLIDLIERGEIPLSEAGSLTQDLGNDWGPVYRLYAQRQKNKTDVTWTHSR